MGGTPRWRQNLARAGTNVAASIVPHPLARSYPAVAGKPIILVGLIIPLALSCTSTATSSSHVKFEAFDVCTQFVKQHPSMPGSETSTPR